ncbi:zinc finger protein, subfamily 1A, 4 (Eos), isoform CRA_a [Mus musculus]|uniref:IKAROS family zinc finger 4 n=1 Tax=Mus musculus TaxID=10090 RepID=A0A1Y7VK04_MOUSE|nr:zinc finger protein, subfamily 1A, 4 (Eos), isoform CRA_a [Mus musculus]
MHTPPALPRRFQGGGRVRTPGSHRQGKDNLERELSGGCAPDFLPQAQDSNHFIMESLFCESLCAYTHACSC